MIKALKELKTAIEGGKIDTILHPLFERAFYSGGKDMVSKVYPAGNTWAGSTDAAFALMQECLGDRWRVQTIRQNTITSGWEVRLVFRKTGEMYSYSENKSLPAAILLAVIQALIYEEENQ